MHHDIPTEAELARIRASIRYVKSTGKFYWKISTHGFGGNFLQGSEAKGTRANGHIRIGSYRAHHLAWFFVTGSWLPDGYEIHHKDGDWTNNAWRNLQAVTRKQHVALSPKMSINLNDPETQAKAAAARAQPEVRRRINAAISAAMRRPEIIAKSQTPAAKAKRNASVAAAWADQTLRDEQSERRKAHLADPVNRAKHLQQMDGIRDAATTAAAAILRGSRWITNGDTSRRIAADVPLPEGWRYGKRDKRG